MPDRKTIVKNGVAVASGNVMRPPLRITQKGSSIFINSYQVYPIPKALPDNSDGEYPKLQALIKKMENDLLVLDDPSYDEQVNRVTGYCKDAGYVPKISGVYQDIVVETEPGIGRILLINDVKLKASRGLIEPTLGGEDKTADSFFDALAEQLQSGGLVLFGRGFLNVVPNAHVDKTANLIEKISHMAKVSGKMSGEMLSWQRDMDVTAAVFKAELAGEYPAEKLALITFHTDIWDVFLQMSPPSYLFLLAMRDLPKQGFITTVLDDYAITVSAWDSWLKKGAKVFHNMSHGDIVEGEVVIKVGNDRWGKPTHYFNASHVALLKLNLPESIIYN